MRQLVTCYGSGSCGIAPVFGFLAVFGFLGGRLLAIVGGHFCEGIVCQNAQLRFAHVKPLGSEQRPRSSNSQFPHHTPICTLSIGGVHPQFEPQHAGFWLTARTLNRTVFPVWQLLSAHSKLYRRRPTRDIFCARTWFTNGVARDCEELAEACDRWPAERVLRRRW